MERPPLTAGLRHVALYVRDLSAAEAFYVGLMGMEVEWRPDPDNVYLTSGTDNLALHQTHKTFDHAAQLLDHVGFVLRTPQDVDAWFEFLSKQGIEIKAKPRTHRDGARSFYCVGPEQVVVQMIYHPPLAKD
ncbi:MAG: VOC family protein [Thiogranum sp.]|nr:VOC family protein [Thiogranum sp.]